MNEIIIQPYTKLANKTFVSTTLSLKKNEFDLIPHRDNDTEYSIFKCFFGELSIENFEDIDYENIHINFYGCIIKRIDIEKIKTKNISISFTHSFIGGRINSSSIEYIQVYNCLIYHNFFFINQKKVTVNNQESTIYFRVWYEIFKKLNANNPSEVLKIRQSFDFHDCQEINFKTDFVNDSKKRFYFTSYKDYKDYRIGYNLNKKEKELLDISVHIMYF